MHKRTTTHCATFYLFLRAPPVSYLSSFLAAMSLHFCSVKVLLLLSTPSKYAIDLVWRCHSVARFWSIYIL